MSLNIVENAIGQQIAGRKAVGQQFADLRRRNRQLGHGEGDDATGRCRLQAGSRGQPARGKFARQFAGQAADLDRETGAVRDGDMSQREQVTPAVPTRQAGEGIGTDSDFATAGAFCACEPPVTILIA